MRAVLPLALTVLAGTACAADAAPPTTASAALVGTEGQTIGTATFEQTPSGVLIVVQVAGLPPGAHGIHLHGVGTCSPDFTAAKGHINPEGVRHGLRNPDGPDSGDLPNLYIAADGTGAAEFYTTRVSVAGNAPALLDEDGATVIIHANPDDHLTQPIGGAGGRIGCGVITATAPEEAPAVNAE